MATKQLMLEMGAKAVERLGKKQLWRIPRCIRRQPSPTSANAIRECLRDIGVFISDDHFNVLTSTYAHGDPNSACDVDALMGAFIQTVLNHRRRYVVELVLKKLDPERTGLVRSESIYHCYDALRHPLVLTGARDIDDVTAQFFDELTEDPSAASESDDGITVTAEELTFYYCGISLCTPNDEDFEIRCIRSFSLDRPRFDAGDEAERLAGSRAAFRQSRLLGEGRVNPLYTTTNADYGSSGKEEPLVRPLYGRTQKFTRSQPPRSGGATAMNM